MKTIDKALLAIILLSVSSISMADDYQVYRIHKLETIAMEYKVAKKVVPIIRTLISTHGHIAHLEGSDNLIIKATPSSISNLRQIL